MWLMEISQEDHLEQPDPGRDWKRHRKVVSKHLYYPVMQIRCCLHVSRTLVVAQ
jgi:hypothetical protein